MTEKKAAPRSVSAPRYAFRAGSIGVSPLFPRSGFGGGSLRAPLVLTPRSQGDDADTADGETVVASAISTPRGSRAESAHGTKTATILKHIGETTSPRESSGCLHSVDADKEPKQASVLIPRQASAPTVSSIVRTSVEPQPVKHLSAVNVVTSSASSASPSATPTFSPAMPANIMRASQIPISVTPTYASVSAPSAPIPASPAVMYTTAPATTVMPYTTSTMMPVQASTVMPQFAMYPPTLSPRQHSPSRTVTRTVFSGAGEERADIDDVTLQLNLRAERSLEDRMLALEDNGRTVVALLHKISASIGSLQTSVDAYPSREERTAHTSSRSSSAVDSAVSEMHSEFARHLDKMDKHHNHMSKLLADHAKKNWSDETLDAIEELRHGVHAKLDAHKSHNDRIIRLIESMPDHDTVLQELQKTMVGHINEHRSRVTGELQRSPAPTATSDDKLVLKAIENMQESVLSKALEAVYKTERTVLAKLESHERIMQADQKHLKLPPNDLALEAIEALSHGLHSRFDAQEKNHQKVARLMETMPSHEALLKGFHSTMGEHSSRITSELKRLPVSTAASDDKLVLRAIENMQESVLSKSLEAAYKTERTVLAKLEGHERNIQESRDALHHLRQWLNGRLEGYDDRVSRLLEGMPDHDTLVQGVHSVMERHINDHGERMSSEINRMPLAPDEKVMLQAIENMQETVLSKMLEAILQVQAKLDGYERNQERMIRMSDRIPDNDAFARGVHDVIEKRLNDHGIVLRQAVRDLVPRSDDKFMLGAVESMEAVVLRQTVAELQKVKKELLRHSDILHQEFMEQFNGFMHSMEITWNTTRVFADASAYEVERSEPMVKRSVLHKRHFYDRD